MYFLHPPHVSAVHICPAAPRRERAEEMTRAGGKGRSRAAIFYVLSQGQQRGSEKEIVVAENIILSSALSLSALTFTATAAVLRFIKSIKRRSPERHQIKRAPVIAGAIKINFATQ